MTQYYVLSVGYTEMFLDTLQNLDLIYIIVANNQESWI